MKTHLSLPLVAIGLVSAALVASGCSRAEAQTANVAGEPGRGPIELVVYTGDFAQVREMRKVDLSAGRNRIGVQGISKSLDQNSVIFSWPSRKDATVLSSTYDLGTNDSGHLLQRFLGHEVELVYRSQDGQPGERTSGILEVADPGNIVVRADGKYIVNPNATIEAPADQGIVTIPQLSAEVESKSGGATEMAVSYMTPGLSWNADYTVTLAPDKPTLGLECWATVTNRTGTDFPNAQISFVAGSPNRAVRERQVDGYAFERDAAKSNLVEGYAGRNQVAAPQALGELYAYPYKSSATIKQDQMNRVRMMGSDAVSVKKVYSVALPSVYRDYAEFGGNPDQRIAATMGINFSNSKGSGLGLPLPAGAIRVYEPDATGASRYIGAASIGDTPKDAPISLTLTNVFDVYARVRQVSAKKLDKKHTSRTVEVRLTNEKSVPVELRTVENFGGTWKIADETHRSQKLNASSNQWTLNIPAGGETILRYTVILGG